MIILHFALTVLLLDFAAPSVQLLQVKSRASISTSVSQFPVSERANERQLTALVRETGAKGHRKQRWRV